LRGEKQGVVDVVMVGGGDARSTGFAYEGLHVGENGYTIECGFEECNNGAVHSNSLEARCMGYGAVGGDV